jgi:hypothetical protein
LCAKELGFTERVYILMAIDLDTRLGSELSAFKKRCVLSTPAQQPEGGTELYLDRVEAGAL